MLGEVGSFTKGAPLSKADISEEGTPFILYGELYTTYNEVTNAIVRKTDKTADSSQYSRIGDVIIPTSGETPEEIATATCVMLPNVILAGDLNIFRSTKVDGRIISYIINHIVNQDISRVAQGKSVVHIKADELSKIRINYPNSEEQKKLIRFLEILSARIEKQCQFVEALKSYKRGALSKLFPQNGETTPQYRFAGFTEPWERKKLGDVVSILGGNAWKSSDYNSSGTHLVVTIANVTGETYINDTVGNRIAVDESNPYKLCENDILISLTGNVGRVSKCTKIQAVLNQRVGKITLKDTRVCKDFVFHILHNSAFENAMLDAGQGAAQKNIGNKDVENYDVSLPDYLDEQHKVAEYLSDIDRLITHHQEKLKEIQTLKFGLLQQLFI